MKAIKRPDIENGSKGIIVAIVASRKRSSVGVAPVVSRYARSVLKKTNGASATGRPGFARTVSEFE